MMIDSGNESDDDIPCYAITDMDTDGTSQSERSSETDDENANTPAQKRQTLRQRRLLKTYNLAKLIAPDVHNSVRAHWISAIAKATRTEDPWKEFHIENSPTEVCRRHRYNAVTQKWTVDEVKVKMEKNTFTKGAMRECFRLKKLSNFTMSEDWSHSYNYVAKRYMQTVAREVYFEDVKLQMDTKLWGEEYNRHNPPKKVDIFQMYILEFKDRPESPLYHLEHFIEGRYVKYNSNSGFVEMEENARLTPQAFSHFTFERSGHQLIVVDIQGVEDLYTDPQIHTVGGKGYGDGNLGEKGMALFFHSHVCNTICESMGLMKFDLAPSEEKLHDAFMKKQRKSKAMTCVRGEVELCVSASPKEHMDLTHILQSHAFSVGSPGSGSASMSCSPPFSPPFSPTSTDNDEPMYIDSPVGSRRIRFISESENSGTHNEEESRAYFQSGAHQARPSCISHERESLEVLRRLNQFIGSSVLGQIHHEMAKYHELGRFTAEGKEDWEAALFHEVHAAELGVMEAILTLARLYLGLQHDVLTNCTVQNTEENINIGVDYMMQAATAGDRSAMIYMARAFQTGLNLGTCREKSWEDAVRWYEEALNQDDHDEGGEYDSTMDDPAYDLKRAMAEMYQVGGFGLEQDLRKAGELYGDAADAAMQVSKGKLAGKFFALAEECLAMVSDEE